MNILKFTMETFSMSNKSSKDLKAYKTSATLFSISGIVFIIVGTIGGKIGIFLPIGVAFIIISIAIWQYSNKLIDSKPRDSST